MRDLVQEMESEIYDCPTIEHKLVTLSEMLQDVKGKKVYGYLEKPVKAQVDVIVDELARLPAVAECYEVWNKPRDELSEEEEVLAPQTHWQMVNAYREAKYVLDDDEASWTEQEEAVQTLEQLWGAGLTVAAHQLGKCWRDGLGVLPDSNKAELWFRRSAEIGNDFRPRHGRHAASCRPGRGRFHTGYSLRG